MPFLLFTATLLALTLLLAQNPSQSSSEANNSSIGANSSQASEQSGKLAEDGFQMPPPQNPTHARQKKTGKSKKRKRREPRQKVIELTDQQIRDQLSDVSDILLPKRRKVSLLPEYTIFPSLMDERMI